ncbi:c-type cytochrome [Rhodophyticola porphyridii]|uniref:Cytochrome c n=1 Tax=Rhodophyticola porphyridii TaxID=1852017 RepID=A0A3L9XZK9_9RHOB|nr:cytochrome c [Rhodophyticola porphyridii]RMA41979.1 cytochrome c [Rhodophyticola porphyridii]
MAVKALILTGALLLGLPALAQDVQRGERLYFQHCAVCHGEIAQGGGPMAEVLMVPPPDLTRIAERRDGVFPVIQIARLIDGRDPILTHGGDMPIFGFVFGEFNVVLRERGGGTLLTSREVVDLVGWLETVQVE